MHFFSFRFSFLNKENISEERLSPKSGSGFISLFAYNDSKLCNILFSNELNRRLSKHKVYSNAVHPGNVVSSYLSRNWWFYRLIYAIVRPFTKSLVSINQHLVYTFFLSFRLISSITKYCWSLSNIPKYIKSCDIREAIIYIIRSVHLGRE